MLYSSQVVKQADLVFAIYLCGERWEEAQKARDFDYYESVTVRDSSLSASIQAVVAAEVGHLELAWDYLTETALIDLRDLAFNTRDGVHLAALSGVWHAVVAGFGGMRDTGHTLAFAPRLPSRLTRLGFGLLYRGRRLRVEVYADHATYELLDGEEFELIHHGEPITVTPEEPVSCPVPPAPVRPAPQSPAGREPGLQSISLLAAGVAG
jgi:alpha,alpha-trehalose phosphorylase